MNFQLKTVAAAILAAGLVASAAYASDDAPPPAKKHATTRKAARPKTPPPPTVEPRAPQGAPTLGRSADPGTPATVPIVVAAPDGDRWLVDARTTRMPELRRRRVWPYALMVGCVLVALASWRGALPVGGLAATLAGALAAGAQR